MLTITPLQDVQPVQPVAASEAKVHLADGRWQSLSGMSREELHGLQWEQEQQFARLILQAPKGSQQRDEFVAQAYDTVCSLLAAQQKDAGPLVMGLDKRYVRLVVRMLHNQVNRGLGQPRLFEIGFGSGALLKEVQAHGFHVGGVEVSSTMRDQAIKVLGERFAHRLLIGGHQSIRLAAQTGRPSLIYWNDVFEHVCPDEISDYLSAIYESLVPGGALVTITPNWLLRPSDVTGDFCPMRTEARGLHLKEYRLTEVSRLLKRAGFKRVATPLVVSRRRIIMCGSGLRIFKGWFEPVFDRLPVKCAHLLCRGMGMSCTVATKG